DDYAQGNGKPALWLVDADGSEEKYSFDDMRRRSNQMANFLRAQGMGRGDTLLLMLDNVAPLWEAMLACMKLGVIMIPATTLLSPGDLRDRLERGGVTHVIAGADLTDRFADVDAGIGRIAVGEAPAAGWRSHTEAYDESEQFKPEGVTRAQDPLLLYFTSGTTSKPKLVLHTHQSYPVGSLSTMYWLGLQPDDIHFNISSP